MKLHDHFPKVRLPLWATLLAAVLLAGAITLLALWCQPNALRSVLAVFRAQPLLIILNCLPVGMLLLVFTCLLRNVFFAGRWRTSPSAPCLSPTASRSRYGTSRCFPGTLPC